MMAGDLLTFINIYLTPWYNSELHFFDLWSDHHPQPLTAILFILNAYIFDLRMDYEALFSVTFSLLSVMVLWHMYDSTPDTKELSFGKYVFILVAAAFLFSLTSPVIYTWSLVTQGYIFVFFGLLTLLSIERLLRTKVNFYRFWLDTLFISLLLIAFSDGAKLLTYSCFAVTFLSFLLDRDKKWLLPILSIGLAIILQFTFFQLFDFESLYSEMNIAISVVEKVQYLPEYFLYIGTGLLGVWGNLGSFVKQTGASREAIYFLSSAIFIVYLYTLFIYFKNRLYSKSIVPGTLILTSFLAGVGGAMFRFNPDTQPAIIGNMPRYYLLYVLGAIGVTWIWCMYLQNKKFRKRTRIASYTIISVILISQLASSIAAWRSSPYIQNRSVNSFNIMVQNANGNLSIEPPLFVVGHNYPEPYLSGLSVLKKHKLNVFSDDSIIEKFQK